MTSEQKYEGKGNLAQDSVQTVNTDPQTAVLIAERRKKALAFIDDHQESADELGEKLLTEVSDLCHRGREFNPTTILADLLQYWLLNANPDLREKTNKRRLEGVTDAIQALCSIGQIAEGLHYFRGEVIAEREVLALIDQIDQYGLLPSTGEVRYQLPTDLSPSMAPTLRPGDTVMLAPTTVEQLEDDDLLLVVSRESVDTISVGRFVAQNDESLSLTDEKQSELIRIKRSDIAGAWSIKQLVSRNLSGANGKEVSREA
jgi:hypothetical protein